MTRWRGVLAVVLLVAAPAGGWAAFDYLRSEEAWGLVEAAATAHERVSYRGRTATRTARWGRPVDVVHDAANGRTRYEWRSKRKRTGKQRGRGYVSEGPSTRGRDPAGFCLDFEALRRNYAARLGEDVRYLGREARIVHLRPRHARRPRLRLVVDGATTLPLEVSTFRADGALYRVAAFRELKIGPQEVAPPRRASSYRGDLVDPSEVRAAAGFEPFAPAYLPAGFRLKECRLSHWARPTVTWLYTDGATAFEVRQSPVLTPLAMEAALEKRVGRERARRTVRSWLGWRLGRLAQTAGDGRPVARRNRHGYHHSYEVRAGEVDVKLSSRDDLASGETASVLRSLRR